MRHDEATNMRSHVICDIDRSHRTFASRTFSLYMIIHAMVHRALHVREMSADAAIDLTVYPERSRMPCYRTRA
jgi:hypothetical protein